MGLRMNRTALLAIALSIAVTSSASANLITYVEQSRNRERLMVMEDDGTNPVELFVGGKDTPTIEYPTVSPAGLAETWILFNDHYDLYKIRPDGSEQALVLCGSGTDMLVAPYYLGAFDALWSPDGSQILVHPTEDFDTPGGVFLALIPANHTADENCTSELVRIYEPPSPWTVDGGPATWNHDGSRIGFQETNMETEQERLAVIERQATGAWQRSDTIELIPGSPDLPDSQPWDLSWRPQAESRLLIFRMKGLPERRVKFWLAAIDLDTRHQDYVLDKGNPVEMGRDSYPRWSSNGDEILFTDPEGNLVRWIYPDGDRHVIGTGFRADWQRDALDLDCNSSGCDDGNPCTTDTCDTDTGVCSYLDNFEPCDDGNDCTSTDTCAGGTCSGTYIGDEEVCNDGFCCGGVCATPACTYDLDCDDGDACTLDFCNWSPCGATCSHTPDPNCQAVDCSTFTTKTTCRAQSDCRWDNRNKVCVPN